ncbi:MAG: IS66 family transposase [Gammaproteobacteria bacterium]|nr:IS66 family transposase [Gammaproteobacteria bacterium]NNJ85172.1 IS66 family transposase [Gammaproteobacteria bacterium]
MILSEYSLRQLDAAYIRSLPEDACQELAVRLLVDLKTLHERLNQNSGNSSKPPSSELPWATGKMADGQGVEAPEVQKTDDSEAERESVPDSEQKITVSETQAPKDKSLPMKPNPGKQPGTPGFGRTQKLPITNTVHHHALCCDGCGRQTNEQDNQVAWVGFYTIDVEVSSPGIGITNTKRLYYAVTCPCGHITRQYPYQEASDELWGNVGLGEWRLVGPMLCALIVSLAYRMRMSRTKIQEFLHDWLGIKLSRGTIQRCVEESARACAPVEDQLVEQVVNSGLLHVDETTHKEKKTLLWLWVFATRFSVLYFIGYRSAEIIENLLGHTYSGWLMSDGYQVYRRYANRLRCWAHLLRKAKGLEESLDQEGRRFGKRTREILKTLMDAVYQAREGPPPGDLKRIHAKLLEEFRGMCEAMRAASHEKTRALAVEFLNDWDAIFAVLSHPHLPLTNNEAERLLRHLVILRRITYGTRSKNGTRALGLLASVVETCRKRQVSPWSYLAQVIRARRSGQSAPALPVSALAL